MAATNFRFNPRPLLLTGESGGGDDELDRPGMFQSTPVIANGRIEQWIESPDIYSDVSIHARYC